MARLGYLKNIRFDVPVRVDGYNFHGEIVISKELEQLQPIYPDSYWWYSGSGTLFNPYRITSLICIMCTGDCLSGTYNPRLRKFTNITFSSFYDTHTHSRCKNISLEMMATIGELPELDWLIFVLANVRLSRKHRLYVKDLVHRWQTWAVLSDSRL